MFSNPLVPCDAITIPKVDLYHWKEESYPAPVHAPYHAAPAYAPSPAPYAPVPTAYAPTPYAAPYVATPAPYAATPAPYVSQPGPYAPNPSPYSPYNNPYSAGSPNQIKPFVHHQFQLGK